MNELLFFILGFIIGALTLFALICFLIIRKYFKNAKELNFIEEENYEKKRNKKTILGK